MISNVVVKYLESHVFHTFDVSETIISENGDQFRSEAALTLVQAPQGNLSERVNKSVIAAIRSYVTSDKKDWDEFLSHICCSLRSAIHSSLGTSSYYMVF